MLNIFWFLVTLVAPALCEPELCTPATCFFEGFCTGTVMDATCHCLEQYYTGGRCTRVVDNCKVKPCDQNKQICRNHMGGRYCECKNSSLAGKNCDVSLGFRSKLSNSYALFTHMVKANDVVPLLIVMDELFVGSYSLSLSWKFGPIFIKIMDKSLVASEFKKTENLRDIAKYYNVKCDFDIPKTPAYYMVHPLLVTNLGNFSIKLSIEDDVSNAVFYDGDYEFIVLNQTGYCYPTTELEGCSLDSNSPLKLPISKEHVISSKVTAACGPTSTLKYTWFANNAFDQKEEVIEFEDKFPKLVLEPYRLEFPERDIDTTWNISVRVDEKPEVSRRNGYAIKTCFVEYIVEPPVAVIKGGARRTAGSTSEIVVDGSDSYDPMDRDRRTPLQYFWNCSTPVKTTSLYCQTDMTECKLK